MLYSLTRNKISMCASTTEFNMLEILAGASGAGRKTGGGGVGGKELRDFVSK